VGGAGESEKVHKKIGADQVDSYVDELIAYVDNYGLDGVDVDIEGGVVDSTYGPFVQKLAAKLPPEGRIVTAAVAQWFQTGITEAALDCLDLVMDMSYDAQQAEPSEHASRSLARARANYWSGSRGVDPSRVVIGTPFYGYCWGTGCSGGAGQIPFRNIVELYPTEALAGDWIIDEENDRTINLNGTDTIEFKAEISQEFGGIMIWDMNQDTTDGRLFEALKRGILK
jgi:GH18 family chitinase